MATAFLRSIVLPILAAIVLTGACSAGDVPMQTPPSRVSASDAETAIALENVIGLWRITSPAGRDSCLVALDRLASGGGYGVHIETCSLAPLASAHDWRPVAGGFELRDRAGATIVRFRQAEEDLFIAVQGRYRMERAPLS